MQENIFLAGRIMIGSWGNFAKRPTHIKGELSDEQQKTGIEIQVCIQLWL